MKRSFPKRKPLKSPRTRVVRKVKPKGISKLKKQLDAIFSLYIRAKYPKRCYTCGKQAKVLQCGHFVPRIYLPTRWDENNCRPQCVGCNIWGRGQLLDFEERLITELGAEAVSRLKSKRNELWKLKPEWYETKIAEYKKLLDEIPTV